VDGSGCLWLLGGDCNDKPDVFWRTCDSGVTWSQISRPTVVPVAANLPVFPAAFSDHSIAIVGDWQLVIVDAASSGSGGVWRFLDREAQFVQKVASAPLPFGQRLYPKLLATSAGTIYLLGGNLCDGTAINDIWASVDIGSTWTCQAVRYATSAVIQFPLINAPAAVAGDDTLFLAGHLPSSSGYTLFSSKMTSTRSSFGTATLFVPTSAMSYTFCFVEGIQAGSGTVQMMDYGIDGKIGGTKDSADIEVSISVTISRQMLTITAAGSISGRRHAITVGADAVRGLDGTSLPTPIIRTFFPDNHGPVVQHVEPGGGEIAPWTAILLSMNEEVIAGLGSLRVQPSVGLPVMLDITASLIVNKKVFFQLPSGVRLTAGQEYSLIAPSGLLQDVHHNPMQGGSVGTFHVLSGFYSANDYTGNLATVSQVSPASSSSGAPQLLSTLPQSGATDVPVPLASMCLLLFFSKSVQLNPAGKIVYKDSSDSVLTESTIGTLFKVHMSVKVTQHAESSSTHVLSFLVNGAWTQEEVFATQFQQGQTVVKQVALFNWPVAMRLHSTGNDALGFNRIWLTRVDNSICTITEDPQGNNRAFGAGGWWVDGDESPPDTLEYSFINCPETQASTTYEVVFSPHNADAVGFF
jgi:hypothetical protein